MDKLLKGADNDNLSSLVATLVDADLLVILSDVAGLFAIRVAACLNAPNARELSEPQLVADAVRAALEIALPATAPLVH